MDTNPPPTVPTLNCTIKREREASAESITPMSTLRHLLHDPQPEVSEQPAVPDSPRPKYVVIAESKWTPRPVELPIELKKALETWHNKEGTKLPPCRYTYKASNGVRRSRAYDRQGREVSLTDFDIKSPVAYGVSAAQFPDGSVKLVCSFFTWGGTYGTYLRAWLGWEGGLEPEPCIIRRFANKTDDMGFQPEAWTILDERLKSVRPVQQASTPQESLPSVRSSSRKRIAPQRSVNTRQAKRQQKNARRDAHSASQESDGSEGSEEESEDSDDEDVSSGVRRRQRQQGSNSNVATPSLNQSPELMFKLTFFKFTVQHARDFPLEECRTSKALFEKARAFYKIFDSNTTVDVLTCQLATRPEQHYLFAGSEGEFNLLVRKAQSVAKELGRSLTIEVGLVRL